MQIRDFSKRKNFPGETGNDFDVILHRYASIQKMPALLFAILLFLLALIPTWFNWLHAVALWVFFLLDWLLLAELAPAGKSFGPAKPPVVILAILRCLFAWLPFPIATGLQAAGTLLVIYGFWIEPHTLKLTHQKLESPKLKHGTPLKVLHLGDLHLERISGRERKLNQLVHDLQPDLILFTGDVLNLTYIRDPQAIQEAREIMGAWQAPLSVYAITGSPAVDIEKTVPKIYEGLGIHLLPENRETISTPLGELDLIGLSCTHRPFVDAPRLESLVDPESNRFTILLYHTPDLAPNAARLNVDLQLSGHTHGGQVRLPFLGAFFTASLYGRAFSSGRYQIGPLTLYITRGIGMEGAAAPRVRFLCPPEVILWEIQGKKDFSHK